MNVGIQVNQEPELALEHEVELFRHVILLVQQLSLSEIHVFKFIDDAGSELLGLLSEELDLFDDWTVRFVDNQVPEVFGHLVHELLAFLVAFLHRVALDMPHDTVEQVLRNVVLFFENF